MSELTRDEQENVVRQALELEISMQNGQKQLSDLEDEEWEDYDDIPKKPVRKIAKQNPVTPDYATLPKFEYTFQTFLEDNRREKPNILSMIFSVHPFKRGLSIAGICVAFSLVFSSFSFVSPVLMALVSLGWTIGSFMIAATVAYWAYKRSEYSKKEKLLSESFMHSPGYLNAKAQADEAARLKQEEVNRELQQQQARYDEEYKIAKEQYDTVILPQYEKERSEWEEQHKQKKQAVSNRLAEDKEAQSKLYETTKIIPAQYRSMDALSYIHQVMSTSDYNLREAIEMYEKELSRRQEAERIEQMHRANALADEQNYRLMEQNRHMMEQNDLLAEQNDLEEKAQRHQERADFVKAVQRHNTNKYLKQSLEKKK